MISRFLLPLVFVSVLGATVSGCSTAPTRQQVGIGAGAVAGGVIGNVLTDGSTLGTVGGAAVGGVIGNEITKPKK